MAPLGLNGADSGHYHATVLLPLSPTSHNKDHHHPKVDILHLDVDADSGGEPFELGEHLLHPQQLPSRLWQEGPPQLWYI